MSDLILASALLALPLAAVIFFIFDKVLKRLVIGKLSRSSPKPGEYWVFGDPGENPWPYGFRSVKIIEVKRGMVRYDLLGDSHMGLDLFRRMYRPSGGK